MRWEPLGEWPVCPERREARRGEGAVPRPSVVIHLSPRQVGEPGPRDDRMVTVFRPGPLAGSGSRARRVPVRVGYGTASLVPVQPQAPCIGLLLDEPIRESGPHLAGLLGGGLGGEGPLYRQLARRPQACGRPRRDPARHRAAARTGARKSLSVSRATVVAAYDRLKAEGWLESRQGSGTWVRRPRARVVRGVDAVATARLFLSGDGPSSAADPASRRRRGRGDLDRPHGRGRVLGTPTINATLASLTRRGVRA